MTANPSEPHIGLVVEGQGDAAAVPVLLRLWLRELGEYRDILGKPISCNGRDKALARRGLEGFVGAAAARPGCKAVLVVLDGEGDPVCQLGPRLLRRAKTVTPLHVCICLAEQKFEDWIYASAETLELGLQYDSNKQGSGSIVQALRPSTYAKPTWQPRLTARMDVKLAESRSISLTRLSVEFERLLGFIDS